LFRLVDAHLGILLPPVQTRSLSLGVAAPLLGLLDIFLRYHLVIIRLSGPLLHCDRTERLDILHLGEFLVLKDYVLPLCANLLILNCRDALLDCDHKGVFLITIRHVKRLLNDVITERILDQVGQSLTAHQLHDELRPDPFRRVLKALFEHVG